MDILGSAGRLILVTVLFQLPLRAHASINWTNRSGGTWSNPLNWDPHQLPGPNDDVRVTVPGTYTLTLDSSAELGALTMGGATGAQLLEVGSNGRLTLNNASSFSPAASLKLLGTLAGDGDLTLQGSANTWAGGTMTGAGTTFIASSASINVSTTNHHDLVGRTFSNQGTVTWSGGRLRTGAGASIINEQSWVADFPGEFAIASDYGGESHFRNNGSFTLNSGIVDVALASESSGSFTLKTNTVLQFLAGHQFHSCSFKGAGVTRWKGRLFACDGTITADRLELDAGSYGGDWTFVGRMDWVNGDMNGRGQLTLAAGSVLNIVGAATDHDFSQHVIVAQGTVIHSGGSLRGGVGSTILNTGTWLEQSASIFNQAFSGAACVFDNQGVFRKTDSAGTTSFGENFQFKNSGTVRVEAGSLALFGGGVSSAVFNVGAGASLIFNSGYDCFLGTRFDGNGAVRFTGGVVLLQGVFDSQSISLEGAALAGTHVFSGKVNWMSGKFSNPGLTTIASGGQLSISTSATHDLPAHSLLNLGTVLWTDGAIRNGQGSRFENRGVFQAKATTGDLAMDNDYGGPSSFANHGTFALQKGNVTLNLLGESSGIFNIAANSSLVFPADHRFLSGTAFQGNGITRLNGGTYQLNGVITSENLELNSGAYSGLWSLAGTANWRSGLLDELCQISILPGSTLQISTASTHDPRGGVINNRGTILWTGGTLRSGAGSLIENQNLFRVQFTGEYGLSSDFGGAATLLNRGELDVEKGILDLTVAGETSGKVQVSSSSTLNILADHRFRAGAKLIGPGVTVLGGGNSVMEGSLVADNFRLSGGSLGGSGTFSGNVDWQATRLDGPGTFTISSGSTFILSTPADHDLPQRTLVNAGTVTHSGGNLRAGNATLIVNTGLWVEQSGLSFGFDFGGAYALFDNVGTFRKLSSSGTTTFASGFALRNAGTVLLEGGALLLGEAYVQRSGTTRLTQATISSTPTLQIQAGSLEGTGSIQAPLRMAGVFAPGSPSGVMAISGDYVQASSGRLDITLAGDPQTKGYGRVQIGGTARLGGTLNVLFDTGFAPSTQSAFPLMTFGGGSGQFATFSYPSSQTTLQASMTPSLYTVTVTKGGIAAPRISVLNLGANSSAISWSSVAGTKYRLQFLTDLSLQTWADLASDVTAQSGTTTVVDVTRPTLAKRFYRVRVVP